MSSKLFLYLDILGFSELVENPTHANEIYQIVDKLNVFTHQGRFECIVFSDTLIVYNSEKITNSQHRSSAIMWMCEFAQDLFYRLIKKDIHFRALLTEGDFFHERLENIQSFYGNVLVSAHKYEKQIKCTGLFMDNRLIEDSNIFSTDQYDPEYSFVHIMQSLDTISFSGVEYPVPSCLILDQALEGFIAYDLFYLKNIYAHISDSSTSGSIRSKYVNTWSMLRQRHALLLDTLEYNNFDLNCVSSINWENEIRKIGTSKGFHG